MALDHNPDLTRGPPRSRRSATRASPRPPACSSRASPPSVNSQQPAAAADELPHPDRRRSNDAVSSSAGIGQKLPWLGTPVHPVVDDDAYRQQQLPEQLQPAAAVGAALNVSQPLMRDLFIDSARQQLDDEPDQPRYRRHAAAREPRPHRREREERVLESGLGARHRRRAAVGARARAGTGAREQGQGRRRHVAAARPRVGTGRGRRRPGTADHRRDRREAGRGSAAAADLRSDANATSGTSRSSRSIRRRSATPALDVDAAVTTRAARSRRPAARPQGHRERPDRREVHRQSAAARRSRQRELLRPTGSAARRCSAPAAFRAPSSAPGDITPFGSSESAVRARLSDLDASASASSYPIGQSVDEANFARAQAGARAGGASG